MNTPITRPTPRATFLYGLERKWWKIVFIPLEFVGRGSLKVSFRFAFENGRVCHAAFIGRRAFFRDRLQQVTQC